MSYCFKFEIIRYYNQTTNNCLNEQEYDEMFSDASLEEQQNIENSFTEKCIALNVKGTGYYIPARIWGDPYDCYPADSDYDLESAKDENGYDWLDDLTDTERSEAMSELASKVYRGKPDYYNYDPGGEYAGFDYYGY